MTIIIFTQMDIAVKVLSLANSSKKQKLKILYVYTGSPKLKIEKENSILIIPYGNNKLDLHIDSFENDFDYVRENFNFVINQITNSSSLMLPFINNLATYISKYDFTDLKQAIEKLSVFKVEELSYFFAGYDRMEFKTSVELSNYVRNIYLKLNANWTSENIFLRELMK